MATGKSELLAVFRRLKRRYKCPRPMSTNPYQTPDAPTTNVERSAPAVPFSRRASLVSALILLVSIATTFSGIAGRYSMFCLLPAVSLTAIGLATIVMRTLIPRVTRFQQQTLLAAGSAVGGLIMSPMVIGFEWAGNSHPWPASDEAYVLLTIARCLAGGLGTGFLTWWILIRLQPRSKPDIVK